MALDKTLYLVTSSVMAASLLLASCGGGGSSGSTPPPVVVSPPPPPPTFTLSDKTEATDFINRGSFGGQTDEIDRLVGTSPSNWLTSQFALDPTYILPPLRIQFENGQEIDNRAHATAFWDAAISNEDQLRQRMVFALSQITVVSDKNMGNRPLTMAHYIDVLQEHAFGNYRDLLQDLTYAPATARFLTYFRNRKGDERTGRMPDENYARELLQLFTLGLVELNMDGTPKTGSNAEPIEIFTNDDIVGLARVFTGLSAPGSTFWSANPNGDYVPLISYAEQHSGLEKTFLGKTITAGTPADDSIKQALDHIFEHPNMAPFLSRQLIQRFTQSHPSPAYVERVATAFETGRFTSEDNVRFGTGIRGDLQATLAAVLLDRQFYDETPPSIEGGKIREPVLKFVHWARAMNVEDIKSDNEWFLLYNAENNTRLAQAPFRSPSVFNFYRPGFVAPGSQTAERNLTAPEFQIVNEGSATGYANFMLEFVFDTSPRRDNDIPSFTANYADEIALADDPLALADHLNAKLLAGRMSMETKDRMVAALNEVTIRSDTAENTAEDKLVRARLAIYMAVTDPAFAVNF